MTGSTDTNAIRARQQRALELYESGLIQSVIAVRLGTTRNHVSNMIKIARQLRDAAHDQS